SLRVGLGRRLVALARRGSAVVVVGGAGRAFDPGGLRPHHRDDPVIQEEPALRAPAVDLSAGLERLRHAVLLAGRTRRARGSTPLRAGGGGARAVLRGTLSSSR